MKSAFGVVHKSVPLKDNLITPADERKYTLKNRSKGDWAAAGVGAGGAATMTGGYLHSLKNNTNAFKNKAYLGGGAAAALGTGYLAYRNKKSNDAYRQSQGKTPRNTLGWAKD